MKNIDKQKVSNMDILYSFFLLGLTSFGGPVAHIGYFRNVFVKQKKWLDEKTYIDFVSLCNFLPGPSSSQIGMSIGYYFKGFKGALLAWIGFTAPSAIILIVFAYTILNFENSISYGIIQGLKAIVVVIVFQAILGMKKNLLKDYYGYFLTIMTSILLILFPSSLNQFLCLIMSGILAVFFYQDQSEIKEKKINLSKINFFNYSALILFFSLLIFLPVIESFFDSNLLKIANSFYRIGSLVFGGGHVVLPLLQEEFVTSGIIKEHVFLAGYGASQAIPGPLFTFSAYLGMFLKSGIDKILLSIFCLFFIFLPSFLLVIGTLPFWQKLREVNLFGRFLKGVNASVIGLLVAVLYDPIILSSLKNLYDVTLVILAFIILFFTKTPQWLAVLILSISGWAITL
ncbi:MAG: chromate efflux transporter [Alphaproteobacteria bacterium]|nr:chromate efflux transporter [Alphaproteobacteria bacterium]